MDIFGVLSELLEDLILSCGVTEFWTGGMGESDEIFSSAVRKLKYKYPQIKLLLVNPYATDDHRRYYYKKFYDDILIPDEVLGAHYRAAIPI